MRQEWVADPTHYGGGYNKPVYDRVPVYDYETKCIHSLGALIQNVRSASSSISAVGTVASLGALLSLMFVFLRVCCQRDPLPGSYSYFMIRMTNVMWPIGVAIMAISAVVWLVG